MRIFLLSFAAIPLLFVDGVLLYGLPSQIALVVTKEEGWILLGGLLVYLLLHFFVRKPERMYLWGHEFAHLMVAKIFFRKVHAFQITSRSGGKVVIDGTNVAIDLAPYAFPLYSIGAGCAAAGLRSASPWVPDIYLFLASFLLAMHVAFSLEGFLKGQPDLRRSGRAFSAAIVLLILMMWIPCLLAPGTGAGWKGAISVYRGWFSTGHADVRRLILHGLALLFINVKNREDT